MSSSSGDQGAGARLVAARLVHGLVAAVVLFSLVLQLVLLFTGGTDANSGESGTAIPLGTRLFRFFSFFTVQSNIIVGVVAVLLAVNPLRTGRVWQVVRLDSLLGIVITGLVYAIVLAPMVQLTGWAQVANIGLHYVSPWASLAAWLVFGPRPGFRVSTAVWAFLWPVLWLIYTFAHGAISHWYPYPFLNADALGLGQAVVNSLLVVLVAAVLAAVLLVIDRRVPAVLTGPGPASARSADLIDEAATSVN